MGLRRWRKRNDPEDAMIRNVVISVIALTSLPGCLTLSGGDVREITSEPAGALVQIDGFGECETPCTVRLDALRQISVAKAGYKAQRFHVSPGGKGVHVILELAAPTKDIDTTQLPALE